MHWVFRKIKELPERIIGKFKSIFCWSQISMHSCDQWKPNCVIDNTLPTTNIIIIFLINKCNRWQKSETKWHFLRGVSNISGVHVQVHCQGIFWQARGSGTMLQQYLRPWKVNYMLLVSFLVIFFLIRLHNHHTMILKNS